MSFRCIALTALCCAFACVRADVQLDGGSLDISEDGKHSLAAEIAAINGNGSMSVQDANAVQITGGSGLFNSLEVNGEAGMGLSRSGSMWRMKHAEDGNPNLMLCFGDVPRISVNDTGIADEVVLVGDRVIVKTPVYMGGPVVWEYASQLVADSSAVLDPDGRGMLCVSVGSDLSLDAPAIADGADKQQLVIINEDEAHTLTLPDESLTPGSNLNLSGNANLQLGPGDSVTLVYLATRSSWFQIGASDN